MQNFTPKDMQPRTSTILFIKQFARMYSNLKSADQQVAAMCLN